MLFSLRHSATPPPATTPITLLFVAFTMETVVVMPTVVIALTVVREEFVGREAF